MAYQALILAISAFGGGLEVDWSSPPGCPDGATIEDAVRARLDATLSTIPATIRGRVEGRPGAWTLELEVRTVAEIDVRRVDDRECTTLGEAAALIVAVTIERAAASEPRGEPMTRSLAASIPTSMAWSEPTAIEPSPEPIEAAPPAPAPRRRSWQLGARIAAGVEVGALPVGADIEIVALLRRHRFIGELGARYEPPRRVRYPDAPGSGGNLSLWAIEAAGCFAPSRGRVRIPLCAGAEAGGMYGTGVGFVVERRAHLPWAAARGSGGVSIAVLPWLRLTANAGVLVPFWQPKFATETLGVLHRAAPVGGRFNLGVEFGPDGPSGKFLRS